MRIILQRVTKAGVQINNCDHSIISHGLLVLLGIEIDDNSSDADWLINKISSLRIFSDHEGKMNFSIQDLEYGEFLVVSQFTLHASTKKGNRPSFIKAARPETAVPLYEYFISKLGEITGKSVKTGVFGADMKVSLVNDGPVTIFMDSKNKE